MDKLELQLFGTIEIDDHATEAMFCVDVDCKNEAMLHWWGGPTEPGAVLIELNRSSNQAIDATALKFFKANATGGLSLPQLDNEKFQLLLSHRALLRQKGSGLEGEWFNGAGKRGAIVLKPLDSRPPLVAMNCDSWASFKDWASSIRKDFKATHFRGHGSSDFHLKTTLHRANFHRLERYCAETLPTFRYQAETVLDTRINPNDGEDFSMLLGLAQHHGMPSPLLDWTLSPYIAAFFAFSDAIEFSGSRMKSDSVRIFALSKDMITRFTVPVVSIPYHRPYLAPLSVAPRKNPRLHAQQGSFLVTNVGNLEDFIGKVEKESSKQYLVAADIPVASAVEALEDLRFMGLTAATLFPGLDGVGRMLRHSMLARG